MKKLLMMIGAAAVAATGANAASVTIDSVTQRWPWNNKIDITYTVTDGQTLTVDPANDVYMKLVFTATINGSTYTIDGSAIGASATGSAQGTQHTVTWTPPADLKVKASGCTMSASLYAADAPSGDDYMVVDLDTGAVTFEGMLYSQELSNNRYNNDTSGSDGANVYKTDKMVLRKVPRWADRASLPNATTLASLSGYPTGYSGSSNNSPTNWNTKLDYYIGMFPVTQAQYVKFGQTNPSGCTSTITDNPTEYRPVERVTYSDLRGADIRAGTAVPTVATPTEGTFLQRLNCKTGNKFAFDLPTEVMFEIACRAGSSDMYYWGSSTSFSDYVVYNESSTVPVGTKMANAWGLFDVVGNVYEWCLDDITSGNSVATRITEVITNPFEPYAYSSYTKCAIRGISYKETKTDYIKPHYRNFGTRTSFSAGVGFRVAYIAK